MNEIWKDISGYANMYQVSNFGRVRSLRRTVYNAKKGKQLVKERELKPVLQNNYLSVCLNKNGKGKNYSIHRLVAETFLENKQNKMHVHHIDENKTNNKVENLMWCSPKEHWAVGKHGEKSAKYHREHGDLLNLNGRKVVCVETGVLYLTGRDAKRKTGIDESSIVKCCKGKRKTAHKFHWVYAEE